MLTRHTQNNYPKSGCDQCKVSQETAGQGAGIPDGKPRQAAPSAYFGSMHFNPRGKLQVNKSKRHSSKMQGCFNSNSVKLNSLKAKIKGWINVWLEFFFMLSFTIKHSPLNHGD